MAGNVTVNTAGALVECDGPNIAFTEDNAGGDVGRAAATVLDAAAGIVRALDCTVADEVATNDVARLTMGATEVTRAEFGSALVDRL